MCLSQNLHYCQNIEKVIDQKLQESLWNLLKDSKITTELPKAPKIITKVPRTFTIILELPKAFKFIRKVPESSKNLSRPIKS